MKSNLLGFLFAFFSMIGLGVSNFLYKKSTAALGPVNTTFFYYLFSIGIATIVWLFFREKGIVEKNNLIYPGLIALFLFSSVLSFNFAVKYINVSIGATIRSLSFIVSIVLAIVFYKEKMYFKDYAAVALAILAIFLFNIEIRDQN